MLNVNLKDSKTGHSPHSNPRDVGKSPKAVVRFKNWTHLISKKKKKHAQYTELSGITGKSPEKCSMKIKLFDSDLSGLKHTLYSSRQQCLLLLNRHAIGQGHQNGLQNNFSNFAFGPTSGLMRIKQSCEGWEQQVPKAPGSSPSFPDTMSNTHFIF